MQTTYACSCGRRHPAGPQLEAQIQELGLTIAVETSDGRWRVPRIYIAVHGLRASEMPTLAAAYGWKPERRKPRDRGECVIRKPRARRR